ncbi:sigma-54 dependent transcriptional regulator [bacterium]|nr:sigma-54 dependent transcriptional regulator [bacterium]
MLLDEITTRSRVFADVLAVVRRVAVTDANVLLTGETGTGKDFVAELIHDASNRRAHPFIKIDCASIPSSLAESEFFGYEKGAFSDASESKMGKLQLSRGGTVYLDGINHLAITVQSKLLRFVQERKVEPLGSSKSHRVDCRLIASCSEPIKTCLVEKQLREDLYYRLAGVSIDLPPLRERFQDIDSLVQNLLKEFNEKYRKKSHLSPEAGEFLRNYRWPGNIRELRNVLEHAVIHCDNMITPLNLSLKHSVSQTENLSYFADQMLSLEDVEKLYIAEVLRKVKGHQIKASKILRMNRKTLMLKKRKYGL